MKKRNVILILILLILSACTSYRITGYQNYQNVDFSNVKNIQQTAGLFCSVFAGSINIEVLPSPGTVFIDGVNKGPTTITNNKKLITGLCPGEHVIKVTKSGHYDYISTKYVFGGDVSETATLSSKEQGSLYITSIPTSADITIDNIPKASTIRKFYSGDVSAGSHTVKIKKGSLQKTVTIDLVANSPNHLNVDLNKNTYSFTH